MGKINYIYCKICAIVEEILNKFKIAHFRLKGIKIGENCHIGKGVRLYGNVEIGDNTVIGSWTNIGTTHGGKIKIGKNCLINSFNTIGSSQCLIIEDDCMFAAYVQITDASHDFGNCKELIKDAKFLTNPVKICRNVWIGSAAMIYKGVTVGEGSIIGAKAFVNKNISPYSIAVGIPAKVIRSRK